MGSLKSIAPHKIFKEIADSIRTEETVTSITQSGDYTTIYCNTESINKNNFVYINCGDLVGNYQVAKIYSDRFEIFYDGATTVGTVLTSPYFQWGNLKDGKIEIQRKDEYPLIFMILPDKYNVDIQKQNPVYIDDVFKFLIVDTFEDTAGKTENSKADYLYENYVDNMVLLADQFSIATQSYKYISRNIEVSRSEEIPIGVTITSNQNGKTENLFNSKVVGCYLELRVKILKQYNC